MSTSLRDFIADREAAIKAQIKALHDELRELRAAKSAIESGPLVNAARSAGARMTHREMILQTLDEVYSGLTADAVKELVQKKFGVEIPLASMSSQLSRAKSDGLLELDHSTKEWRIAKQSAKKNEPPKGGSETGKGGSFPYPAETPGDDDLLGSLPSSEARERSY